MRNYLIQLLSPKKTVDNPNPVSESLDEALQEVFTKVTEGEDVRYELSNADTYPGLKVVYDLSVGAGAGGELGDNYVEIWGISQSSIEKLRYLHDWEIRVYGGFRKPCLPWMEELADASADPLVRGRIWWPLGTAVRPEFKLQIPIIAATSADNPEYGTKGNPPLVLSVTAGQTFASAIKEALSKAYPELQCAIYLSDGLVFGNDGEMPFDSLNSLLRRINEWSKDIVGNSIPNYPGVMSGWRGEILTISDQSNIEGSSTITVKRDYIMGVPTWDGPMKLEVVTPMRSDIKFLDWIVIEGGGSKESSIITSVPSTGPDIGESLVEPTLAGKMMVLGVRHQGDSYSEDGMQWSTVYNCLWYPPKVNVGAVENVKGNTISADTPIVPGHIPYPEPNGSNQ